MQEDAAHQLHVEGTQPERPLGGLAAVGEGFRQQRVEILAVLCAGLKLVGLLDQLRI